MCTAVRSDHPERACSFQPHCDHRSYVRAGVSAISILTDGRHFQGSLEHLRNVKEEMLGGRWRGDPVPLLRKDFIFHPYQLYEARAAGADAILLIAAVLAD